MRGILFYFSHVHATDDYRDSSTKRDARRYSVYLEVERGRTTVGRITARDRYLAHTHRQTVFPPSDGLPDGWISEKLRGPREF